MVPVDLVPGSDEDISREDWNWLRRQCCVRSDWELGRRVGSYSREPVTLCRVYVGFGGRLIRPRTRRIRVPA